MTNNAGKWSKLEEKAIGIMLEHPFWSFYKIGKEMVRRGYSKDPRYLYKRNWYRKWGKRKFGSDTVSEHWKEYMIRKQKYVLNR